MAKNLFDGDDLSALTAGARPIDQMEDKNQMMTYRFLFAVVKTFDTWYLKIRSRERLLIWFKLELGLQRWTY